MNHHIPVKRAYRCIGTVVSLVLASIATFGQTTPAGSNYIVTDRGTDYRVWQKTASVTNLLTGQVTQEVQAYRELGNGLCYQAADGSWTDSQDLVEVTPTGAQAVHGPMPVYLNSDITAASAISLLPPAASATTWRYSHSVASDRPLLL
jgi:hypothetical protein